MNAAYVSNVSLPRAPLVARGLRAPRSGAPVLARAPRARSVRTFASAEIGVSAPVSKTNLQGKKIWNKPYPMSPADAAAGWVTEQQGASVAAVPQKEDNRSPTQKMADDNARKGQGFFFVPEDEAAAGAVRAGDTVRLYYNRRRTDLNNRPNVYLVAGFDKWEGRIRSIRQHMEPGGLFESDQAHWWTCKIEIPEIAQIEMNFVFSDGEDHDGVWDNNNGQDYSHPVLATQPPPEWMVNIAKAKAAKEPAPEPSKGPDGTPAEVCDLASGRPEPGPGAISAGVAPNSLPPE